MTTKYLGDGIWARRTNIDSSDIMLPIERQASHHESLSVQTNVVVAPSANADSSTWLPCDGFDKIAVSLKNSGAFASEVSVLFSHDNANIDGIIDVLSNATPQYRSNEVPVCAPFFKIRVTNKHTAPATMSTKVLLKA